MPTVSEAFFDQFSAVNNNLVVTRVQIRRPHASLFGEKELYHVSSLTLPTVLVTSFAGDSEPPGRLLRHHREVMPWIWMKFRFFKVLWLYVLKWWFLFIYDSLVCVLIASFVKPLYWHSSSLFSISCPTPAAALVESTYSLLRTETCLLVVFSFRAHLASTLWPHRPPCTASTTPCTVDLQARGGRHWEERSRWATL